jgi:hypothetical protein
VCKQQLLRGNNGAANFLCSKEGVSQGDPLSMFALGTGILPALIRLLKAEFPQVEQPWHADDAGAGGKFEDIRRLFRRPEEIGLSFGYFLEPSKSILGVRQLNLEAAQKAFPDFGFKVTTGSRYLGGFVDEDSALRDWIRSKNPNFGRKQRLIWRQLRPTFRKLPVQVCRNPCNKNGSSSNESPRTSDQNSRLSKWPCPEPSCQLCLAMTTTMMILGVTSPVSQ